MNLNKCHRKSPFCIAVDLNKHVSLVGYSQYPESLEVAHALGEILRWKYAISSLSLFLSLL